jgi:FtsP/CotA-like multicopper oxidase with cupredoxin domain
MHVSGAALANTTYYKLYINAGIYTAVDGAQFASAAFNFDPNFTAENARLTAEAGDTLVIKVINTDSNQHGFTIQGQGTGLVVDAGDSSSISAVFTKTNTAFIYYDHLLYPANRALGLAGVIHVASSTAGTFYWNMKEFQKDWADDHASGNAVDWSNYYPDYFTVNGRSNPQINDDPAARVTGKVNEIIHIVISNTGQSVHSIHLHGYHAEIIHSSANPGHVGRSKDTFPIQSMQTLILEMIPDKIGEYPAHDHNLVAVSAGGIYPNGMFLTMLIQ